MSTTFPRFMFSVSLTIVNRWTSFKAPFPILLLLVMTEPVKHGFVKVSPTEEPFNSGHDPALNLTTN